VKKFKGVRQENQISLPALNTRDVTSDGLLPASSFKGLLKPAKEAAAKRPAAKPQRKSA